MVSSRSCRGFTSSNDLCSAVIRSLMTSKHHETSSYYFKRSHILSELSNQMCPPNAVATESYAAYTLVPTPRIVSLLRISVDGKSNAAQYQIMIQINATGSIRHLSVFCIHIKGMIHSSHSLVWTGSVALPSSTFSFVAESQLYIATFIQFSIQLQITRQNQLNAFQ